MNKKDFQFLIIVFSLLISPMLLAQDFEKVRLDPHVESIFKKMTIEEKIGQLNLVTPGGTVTGEVVSKNVEEKIKNGEVGGIFGIRGAAKVRKAQEIAVNNSRLGIPILFGMDVIHGHQTMFPIPLGLSASWDLELIKKSARIAALEASADGLMWTFSPMVDISRDPRWGRISEGSGEDPFLGAAIAEAMVKGYQQEDLSLNNTIAACVKHFALYGAAEGGRDYAVTDMSKLRMLNEYLPPYQAAIDAGASSVMTSFNAVDYVPASANDFLYKEILRGLWQFNGLVITDYTAISEMVDHGIGNLEEVSSKALQVGVDMDMVSEGFIKTFKESLDRGLISQKMIDQACRRVLKLKQDLGLFEDPFRYFNETAAKDIILSSEHRSFARTAAAESFVLLKNTDALLPLNKNARIAVIGPLADSRRNMLGTWSVSGDHSKAVTVIEGIQAAVENTANTLYCKGANISDNELFAKRVNVFGAEIIIDERLPDQMIKEAINLAEKSDVIVAVVGEAADMSGESSSMANIGLQAPQLKLLKALKKTGKPIVMVLFNGRPMTLNWENENMDAILDVWFGGTETGNAVADVLFGDVNPSGKITASFPYDVGQIPVYHSMLNTGRPYDGKQSPKFRSNYLDIPNDPLFPFGYGLSYSNFQYENIKLSSDKLDRDSEITASIEVTNLGEVQGREVVQLYIRDLAGSISRPLKELKGFKKILLDPGETKKVEFQINEDLLRFYNFDLEYLSEPGFFELMIGTNSRDTQVLRFELL